MMLHFDWPNLNSTLNILLLTQAWLRAGDALVELRFPNAAAEHYEVVTTLWMIYALSMLSR